MSSSAKTPLLVGIFTMRCPTCRTGRVFVNKSVFPLGKCLTMVDHCAVCNHKMKHESNNGGGINYALTMMLFFLNLLWYWPIFGMSYKDYSIFYFMGASIAIIIIAQPWLMRLSRMIYLYAFASFGTGSLPGNK